MKEDFLHYLWVHKKIPFSNLVTVNKESLQILNFGNFTQLEGPDIFNAIIRINQQKWAGNIEIHLKSSDWFLHNHDQNKLYENVILHVVWEHDLPVFDKNNREIPVLELKKYVSIGLFESYGELFRKKKWINCEESLNEIEDFVWEFWKEKLFMNRLERKVEQIKDLLFQLNNDWENVFYKMLLEGFGLNLNAGYFLKIAEKLPFSIIRKELGCFENIEALFFGVGGFLSIEYEDQYLKEMKKNWEFLRHKYLLDSVTFDLPKFYKVRPDNFPTIRLSQIAMVLYLNKNIFERCIKIEKLQDVYTIFQVEVSEYWHEHYLPDKKSLKKRKRISKSFVDLLLINAILPSIFTYFYTKGFDYTEKIFEFMKDIKAEENAVLNRFQNLNVKNKNALDSQSLLELKKEFCNHSKCLKCQIGINILKKNNIFEEKI